MKDLYTKKLSGPPLPHDEWVANHRRLEDEEIAKAAGIVAPDPEDTDDDEPKFGGHPLAFFEGKTDEEILDLPRIGKAILADIREAQAARK